MKTFLTAVILVSSCVSGVSVADSKGFELNFAEQERGIDPYPVRILVTDAFLRMDDGKDQGDFLLMDRADGRLLSVTHDTQSILEIPREAVGIVPEEGYQAEDQWSKEDKAPPISGKPMLHYSQVAGGKTCVDVVVAEGLLPEVVEAMSEFHLTMSGQQAQTMGNTPKEFRTPCYQARLVFARAPFLQRGFPVVEWDSQGYRRQLLGFKQRDDLNEALFQIPADYERYGVGGATPL